MNGRIYDPNLGRFMSVDPFIQSPTNTQSINGYSYIMNNPVNGTDPSGYFGIGVYQGEEVRTFYKPFVSDDDYSFSDSNSEGWLDEELLSPQQQDEKRIMAETSMGLNVDIITMSFNINFSNWVNKLMEDKAWERGDVTNWAAASNSNSSKSNGFIEAIRTIGGVIGKIWNSPNTALGLLWGFTGHIVTEIGQFLGLTTRESEVGFGSNAIEFTGNIFGGNAAIALGNTIIWGVPKSDKFYTAQSDHERNHTMQGQWLGIAYLPLNALGWAMSISTSPISSTVRTVPGANRYIHGVFNFMEGPMFSKDLY